MAIEPIYEKINLNERRKFYSEPVKCTVKTALSTDDVKEVLCVTATPAVYGNETTNGAVTFNGKAVFFVCYIDREGEIRKVEIGADFVGAVKDENIKQGFKAIITPEVSKTEYDLSGVALGVSATVTACVETIDSVELSALVGGEGLVVDQTEIQVLKSLGVKESAYPIEEEFELAFAVKEVLNHRASACITAVQCGVGAIIVDGKVFLSVIALQNEEKCSIIKETRVVPFRMELECEDAMPTMRATAKVYEKALKTQVEVDEDANKSNVSISLNLYFSGEAFITQTVSVCKDVFSTKEELSVNKAQGQFACPFEPIYTSTKVNGRAVTEELPIGARLFAVGSEKAELLSVKSAEQGLLVTGVVSVTGYFADGENKAFTRKLETPFETTLDVGDMADGKEYEIIVKAVFGTARLINATEVELDVELNATVYMVEKATITCISETASLGEKQENPHAISVYIPMENEELWSLSKRLNVCPETLVATNPELTFPLKGNERIVVYRQR